MYGNILNYRKARHLKLALVLLTLSVAVYLSQGGIQPPNGGTWQGYLLGTVGALMILLLTFLGVKKRRYHSHRGTVLGWTSAHVYLGLAVIPVATLHSAGQLGWNVHTLAYALLCLVVISGILGLYLYRVYPTRMADNLMSKPRDYWLKELADVNRQAAELAANSEVEVAVAIDSAIQRTDTPTTLITQLLAIDRSLFSIAGENPIVAKSEVLRKNTHQQPLIDFISRRIPRSIRQEEPAQLQKLLSLCSRRQKVLSVLRRDLQYRAALKFWLMFHIPMSIALLAALFAHVISVFLYW